MTQIEIPSEDHDICFYLEICLKINKTLYFKVFIILHHCDFLMQWGDGELTIALHRLGN